MPKLLGDLGSEIKSLRVSQQIYKICKEDTLRFINSATSILRISSSEVTSCEQNHTVERDVGNITYAVVEAGCDFSSPHTLEDHPDVNSDKLMDVGYNCDLFRDDENDTRMNGTKIIPDTNGSEIALKAKRPIHEMTKVSYPKLSGNKSGISSTDSKSMQHFAFDF